MNATPFTARKKSRAPALLLAGCLGLLGGATLLVALWWAWLRPRGMGPDFDLLRARYGFAPLIRPEVQPVDEYDRTLVLPAKPLGLAAIEGALFAGNREKPWGLMRLDSVGPAGWFARKRVVRDPAYGQPMGLLALSVGNGEIYGIASGDWLSRPGREVVVRLGPRGGALEPLADLPPDAGCMAWDGGYWWVGTRLDTLDSPGPAHLYRLDANFKVLDAFDPPGKGCQGLAWDGRRLWHADVHDDTLIALDISGDAPREVYRHEPRYNYLSGLAWDGEALWLAEYETGALHRLHPSIHRAWSDPPELPEPRGLRFEPPPDSEPLPPEAPAPEPEPAPAPEPPPQPLILPGG